MPDAVAVVGGEVLRVHALAEGEPPGERPLGPFGGNDLLAVAVVRGALGLDRHPPAAWRRCGRTGLSKARSPATPRAEPCRRKRRRGRDRRTGGPCRVGAGAPWLVQSAVVLAVLAASAAAAMLGLPSMAWPHACTSVPGPCRLLTLAHSVWGVTGALFGTVALTTLPRRALVLVAGHGGEPDDRSDEAGQPHHSSREVPAV